MKCEYITRLLKDKGVGSLNERTAPRIDSLRKQMREKLGTVLTPKQWKQFQSLMKEERGQQRLARNGRVVQGTHSLFGSPVGFPDFWHRVP